jgi:hypothetical protein
MRPTPKLLLLVGAVVLSAVACTESGDQQAAPTTATTTTTAQPAQTTATPQDGGDLSTPEAAAKAFVAAAGTEELVGLSCAGRLSCVAEHAPDATEDEITSAQDVIREGSFELAEHLKGAEFGAAVDGAVPGTKDVPYRTPAMVADATLTFVESDGEWLYYGQGI